MFINTIKSDNVTISEEDLIKIEVTIQNPSFGFFQNIHNI